MVAIPLGLAASWALTRWMAAFLYGVGLAEPTIVVTAAVCVVLAISLAAMRPLGAAHGSIPRPFCARSEPVGGEFPNPLQRLLRELALL